MVRYLVLFMLVLGWAGVSAADIGPDALGARVGLSASSMDALYHQTDVALRWELAETDKAEHERWGWVGGGRGWGGLGGGGGGGGARARGGGGGRGPGGWVAGAGPVLLIGKGSCPLTAELGVSPTYISRDHFGEDDFGSQLQFTTRGGLGYRLSSRLRLVYCLQHMSNAELATPNPGLNLHTLTLFFRL